MATYYVDPGATDDLGAGTSWATAKKTLAAGIALCTTDGDQVYRHYAGSEELPVGAYTFTIPYSIKIISVDKNSSDAPTPMGETYRIGRTATDETFNWSVSGGSQVYVYGLTWYTKTTKVQQYYGDGSHQIFEDCTWWSDTASVGVVRLGVNDQNTYFELINPNFYLLSTSGGVTIAARVVIKGGKFSANGAALTTCFSGPILADCNIPDVQIHGFDFSNVSSTATLVANATLTAHSFHFVQCKIPASCTVLATQTNANFSGGEVWLHDCSSDGTNGIFGYYNGHGSIVTDSTIKFTGGAAGQSWKITTASTVTPLTPFMTPWIDLYHDGTSAITPYIEILRDNNATAWKDSEVWGEFTVQVTASKVLPTFYNDRDTLVDIIAGTAGTNQDTGADTWDGENATHWSGKVTGSSATPAEPGHVRGRVCVGIALDGTSGNILYVDPQIRT